MHTRVVLVVCIILEFSMDITTRMHIILLRARIIIILALEYDGYSCMHTS